ncbi:helix-turn-helix transcriptional regulator [Antribacter gilvus]|uniref:helix-turn-helix transcriptional regulator n=1 Tax=Antribacter gilvus TaxID=2304675 RepID=UPI001F0B8E88|nr:helix-turn-helix domain-containing protein [Antribacter gilvus]
MRTSGRGRVVCHAHLTFMDHHTENSENLSRTPLWTLDELCTKLRATPRTVHGWRRRGTAPAAYKIGRHLMFDEADVRAWLEARRTTSAVDDDADGTGTDDGSGW